MSVGSLGCGGQTAKAVADARHGLYQGGTGAIGFDFLAETAHVGAQYLWINGTISPPNLGEYLLEGENFAVVPTQ